MFARVFFGASLALAVAVCAGAQVSMPLPPTRHEIIRGVVTTGAAPNVVPVAGADVIATRAPDRAFLATKTDSAGRYTIDWREGTGDYLLHVSAIGFDATRRRVTRQGNDTLFVVDVTLAPTVRAQVLAPVVATARRPRPDRNPAFGADVGASEQLTGGLIGKLPPDLAGDLAALAATLPGVTPTAGGISVLGLPPDQNNTTLNGMAFASSDVPRDANTRVRVSASAYDPSRGWFSGANTNVELAPGQLFGSRRSHITLDAPVLQYTDPVSARLGQRFTSGQLSYGADGELFENAWYYNTGIQGGRRSAPITSLQSAAGNVLRPAGVASDSVARLLSLLRSAGVPVSAAHVPAAAVTDNVSFIGRFDRKPFDPVTLGPSRSTWGLTTYGKLARSGALATTPTATPGHGGESSQAIGSLQATYSTYFGSDYLADVRSGFSYTRNNTSPYLALPDGRVRVESDLAGGDGSVTQLEFGGNAALSGDSRQWTWETAGDVQFYASGTPRHRVKVSGDVRLDGYSQTLNPNMLGTFTYNSLADVGAGTPASFTRTLNAPRREGAEWNAFLAASDLWRISPAWQVLYGARIEGNAFTRAPDANPVVATAFGARTNHAPAALSVSPRLGFTYNRSAQIRNANIDNGLGRFTSTTPGVLRGGIGEFRGLTPANLLATALVNTGLPGAVTRVGCIGSSVPRPDWVAYTNTAAIPSLCVGGASSFVDASPNVFLFDPSWKMARSWRGNLAWSSVFKRFNYTLEGIYSLNLNQPGSFDLNFANATTFSLPGEGRAMFVSPSGIVASTGVVSLTEARRSSEFGRVISARGDGRSESRQASLVVSPNLVGGGFTNFYVAAGYTLSSIRAARRGFDASTFGPPTERVWARGDLDARHQLLLQGGYSRAGLTLTMLGRAQSGLPFTPLVGSDVNGDGLPNDRAFIFDPARAPTTALSSDLRTLLASSSSSVRRCLTRQFDRPASMASCEGPWTASLNTRLGYAGDGRRLSRRIDIGLNFSNPLGGLDQLLHGSNKLHGWGAAAVPDPVLFTVTGWDPAAQRFQYSVNPRFGSTRPSATTTRAPFRVTLDVSVDVGRPIEQQQVDRWLKPGRGGRGGVKADAIELKRRYDRNVPDLYQMVLQQTDSLLLSRDQVESLQRARATYRARLDSVWTGLAQTLADLPDDYDSRAAYRTASGTIDEAWELTRLELKRTLPEILNRVQIQLLPGVVRSLVQSTAPVRIRLFITG